ncbi:MAG: putative Mg(2+) transport ATPase [Chloroflexi bacterium ADurb.Bin360]|nr:MAG: putative Mg(2+) transport ATPase [Chloroflexi bacterium ADurb.Bin360]
MDGFNFQDLTGVFSVTDVVISLLLSFALCAMIGWVYQITHRGASYTQSFVHTLVLNGMIVAVVMLIIGSNIARAFALIGSLSIIRFRNAVKETRDVGFIFFTMAVGMAVGTKFYLLAVITAVFVSLIILVMTRFNWYARRMISQILKIQVLNDAAFDTLFNDAFLKYTSSSELISVDSVRGGALTELTYSVGLKKQSQIQEFLAEIKRLNGNNRVTLIAGYNNTDL